MFSPSSPCLHALILDDEEAYEEYIAMATDYIRDHPDAYTAINNRGVAYAEFGDLKAALSDFLTASAINHDDSIPHLNIATLLEETSDLAGALEQIDEAIHLAPSNASYHFVRAEIHRLMGDPEASEADRQTGARLRSA